MPKFDPRKDIPDLSKKVILVTGGNAGLGAATVRAIAAHGPECIYLAARKIANGEHTANSIREQHPKANIKVLELDLNSFSSVKKCAAEFNAQSGRLDILFLNAGVCALKPGLTDDGYEKQFGINHMGHALLTQLLMPKMLQTLGESQEADVRIVVVSSIAGHTYQPKGGLALDHMKEEASSWMTLTRYGHSKLANQLFARKLAQVYPSVTSTSLHPGTVNTEIWSKADGIPLLGKLISPTARVLAMSAKAGAKTQLWCAFSKTGKGGVGNGKFYVPVGKENNDNKNAKDQRLADELWRWTNEELAKHGLTGWPEA